jgi:hypothetical protein
MIPIYIPTRGRPDRQPLADMLTRFDIDFTLVCSKDDPTLSEYLARWPKCIWKVTADGITAKRQKILACDDIDDRFVMMDDDLRFYQRDPDGKRFHIVEHAFQMRMLLRAIDENLMEAAHVGLSDKYMAQMKPRGLVRRGRYNQVLGYNRALFPDPMPRFRTITNQEHDMHLQLAAAGLAPVILTEWSKDATYYAKGGCSLWRTPEVEKQGFEQLRDNFPDLVTIVPHPKNISGLAIRVKWAKAVKEA